MSERPPEQLVALLDRLGLAAAADMARVGRRVRRLARDLPRFESIWVDALLQARSVTPFQAAEINAGRGESLRLGPFLLCERLPQPYYVACYRARNVDSQQMVRLAVADNVGPQAEAILCQLESLVRRVKRTAGEADGQGTVQVPCHAGTDGKRIYAAETWTEGRTAAEWMVHHGRFSPVVVLEIARAMLVRLIELEQQGICHGDVSTASLVLRDDGGVALSLAGLRGILRPEEGYAHADLLPEAYDSMAPERISAGTPPDVRSDIYACGCVWWHLLCGRPPLVGGNSLAKLRAAQAAEICDVRRYAPNVPAPLAAAISSCLQREPGRRPESLAQLAALLGPPTRGGKEALADCLARAGRPTIHWTTTVRSIRRSNRTPLWMAGTVCCLAAMVALFWPMWQRQGESVQAPVPQVIADAKTGHALPPARPGAPALTQDSRPHGGPYDLAEDDGAVVPVAYRQAAKLDDLVLDDDRPTVATTLTVQADQCIRGPAGRRATVLVPRSGWTIDKENVRFENLDFVWHSAEGANDLNTALPAIVQLFAGRADFRGCSFECDQTGTTAPSAIRWTHPARKDRTETSLPNGRLQLVDCVMRHVAVGIDCCTVGALSLNFRNVLVVEAGPVVRLDHCPRADEPVAVVLAQVTLRDGGPLLECRMSRPELEPGAITIHSAACAFVPASDTPLVRIVSAEMPGRVPAAIRWTGQGTLVAPQTAILVWHGLAGDKNVVDEASLAIAGFVRSQVQFAGAASGDPAANRLTRWQAPIQSADAPGIDPQALPALSSAGTRPGRR